MTGVRRALLIALVATAAAPAGAVADEAPLTVRDLGQEGMLSSVAQGPLSLTSRGTCPFVRTLAEANGGPSACPPGTWPAPVWTPSPPNPEWAAAGMLQVAGGDRLELTYPGPVSGLEASATTSIALGVRTPPCPSSPPGSAPSPCLNGDEAVLNAELGDLHPTATADPAVWQLTVPVLTPVTLGGAVVALTAHTAAGERDDVFAASSPRYDVASDVCSAQFVNPGVVQHSCGRDGMKGQPPCVVPATCGDGPAQPGAGVTTPAIPAPTLRSTGALRLRGARLRLRLAGSQAGTLRVRLRHGGATLLTTDRTIEAGPRTVTIELPRKVRARLRPHRAYVVSLRLTTASGGVTQLVRTARWTR